MADLTVKQHDTYPPLLATLSDTNGPVNLTNATQIKLIMSSGAFLVTGVCTVVSAPAGTISYAWAVGDTANVGTYNTEFEVTWTGGGVQTFPNSGYKSISIVADLG